MSLLGDLHKESRSLQIKKTGVQYLAIAGSGTSVIVDKDGKPLLSERVDDDQKGTSPF